MGPARRPRDRQAGLRPQPTARSKAPSTSSPRTSSSCKDSSRSTRAPCAASSSDRLARSRATNSRPLGRSNATRYSGIQPKPRSWPKWRNASRTSRDTSSRRRDSADLTVTFLPATADWHADPKTRPASRLESSKAAASEPLDYSEFASASTSIRQTRADLRPPVIPETVIELDGHIERSTTAEAVEDKIWSHMDSTSTFGPSGSANSSDSRGNIRRQLLTRPRATADRPSRRADRKRTFGDGP